MLVFSINLVSAQQPQQFRRVYLKVTVIKNDKVLSTESQNTIIFNYENETVIKIYMADGSVRYFDQIAEREEGSTFGGMTYNGAMYKDRTYNTTVFVQLFEDRQYGVRLVFENGSMIQLFE